MSFYVIHSYMELDKFVAKYPSLPQRARDIVNELLYFRGPGKAIYEREADGAFAGYIFVDLNDQHVAAFDEALRHAALGEILAFSEGTTPCKLSQEEVDHIIQLMRSDNSTELATGTPVRIKSGPYEGMEGVISSIIGQSAVVKVPLRRTVSQAEISLDNLVPVS